jgi:hypothetical protein
MEVDQFTSHHPLSSFELLHSPLDYLLPFLQREIYKTFYIGVYTIFRAVYLILETPDRVPTPQATLALATALEGRAAQFYLGKGGRAECVLDAVVDCAKQESSLGDGMFEETFDCEDEAWEGDNIEEKGYTKLVMCANDLEFGIVRRMVGLRRDICGPYYEDSEHVEMDFNEDD